MSFFGLNFGQNADVDIILDNQDERRMADIKDENGRKERLYLFYDGESVTGKVNVTLHRRTNRLEHQGIKIEFIGQIELYYDRGNQHEFLSLVKELARPGELTQNTSFEFEFNQVEKPFECYTGANVRLRYFLRVSVVRRLSDMVKEMDLLVHTLATYPDMNNPIKMEVGIEECLHIEFEYNKSKYHMKDVIVGKIYFLLVRIKIRHMEVAILKRETTGSGPNTFHDNETIAKYEIMDGAPVKGESIPIRVFLAGYDLTPTMRDVNKKFSVRYFLNLVLVDEEERRYFKQQEITLWRKGERARKNLPLHHQQPPVYQMPHAMARHSGGDQPSPNVRTAPTPSEPNTPIIDAGYGLPAGNHAVGHPQRQASPEENGKPETGESVLEPRPEAEARKPEVRRPETVQRNEANPPEAAGSEQSVKPETAAASPENGRKSPGADPENVREIPGADTENVRENPGTDPESDRKNPGAGPESGRKNPEADPESVRENPESDRENPGSVPGSMGDTPVDRVASQVAKMSTEDDDGRPLPPEDDSVPDMPDDDDPDPAVVDDDICDDDL